MERSRFAASTKRLSDHIGRKEAQERQGALGREFHVGPGSGGAESCPGSDGCGTTEGWEGRDGVGS